MYIVLEGIVGVGKSTQSKLLQEYLKKKFPDCEVVLVREPGSTDISEAIRTLVQATDFKEEMDPICEAYLYAAARAQLLNTTIKNNIEQRNIVISDRSFWSSLAYQGYAKDIGIEKIREINKPLVSSILPDLMLYLDLDIQIALGRIFDSDGDKHERNGQIFFEKASEGYILCLQDKRFAKKVVKIDASGTSKDVQSRIQKVVSTLFIS